MAENLKQMLESVSRSVAEETGYELVDVAFVKEYQRWVLRVFIDHPDGIGLEDCEKVSKALSAVLDAGDPIPHEYTLEVSSPGLDRPLKTDDDFQRFQGSTIKVKTFGPIEGRRNFKGSLVGMKDGNIIVSIEGEEKQIPRDQVASARLVPEF